MKNKVLKIAIAIILLATILMVDFITLGINIVYALETIKSDTNNDNVKFAMYFKTEDEKEVSKIEYKADNDQMKLYAKITVTEGYFDGVITLNNSNFKLKEKCTSSAVSKIEGNTITLNRVRAGNEVEIELGIDKLVEESYGYNMLNQESTLNLSGTYVNSLEKQTSIEAERKVTLSLLSPSNLETSLESKVITNRIYKINGTNKRLVQIELISKVTDNSYPVKVTNFEIALPEGARELSVLSKGTYATNGEAEKTLDSKNCEYDETNRILKIKIENLNKDGKIAWMQQGNDKVIITLMLDEQVQISEQEYTAKSKIEFYGQEEKVLEKEAKYNLSKEADGIIRSSIENQEEIYKGKIYSKEDREYKSTTNIEINYAQLIESATIKEKVIYREEELSEDKQSNVQYKTTTISKAEFNNVLGADGILVIKDQNGNVAGQIKATDFTEEVLVVTYAEGVKELTVEISKAMQTGIIRLNHTKVIKAESYSKQEIDAIKYLVEKVDVSYTTAQYSFERRKTLGEVKPEVSITLDKQTLSANSEDEKLQISLTLKADNEKYELFENPTFGITLPEGITIKNLQNGTITATTEALKIAKLDHSGRVITLEVSGTQQRYVTSDINPQISFTANVDVEKLMANKTGTIKTEFANKGKTYNLEDVKVEVVSSNSKILTHLELTNYNGEASKAEKYSDNVDTVTGKLPLENAETINVPVKYTIVNNFNLPIALKSTIVINYLDKVENKTELLNYEDAEITIEAGQMKVINQNFEIPANLYYSEKVEVKTLVEYTYLGTDYEVANDIELFTEPKEGIRDISIIDNKLQVETFAQLGDGTAIKEADKIYDEQIITYIIQVTNISNEAISNLKVTNKQENGNIYDLIEVEVENVQTSEDLLIEHIYAELEETEKTFELEALNPGEVKELTCRVVVKRVEPDYLTSANISISADGIEETALEKISNKVKASTLKIITRRALTEEVQLYGGGQLYTLTYITNLTSNVVKDIKAKMYLSEGLEPFENFVINAYYKDIETGNIESVDVIKNATYYEEEGYIEFEISQIEADKTLTLAKNLVIEDLPINKQATDVKVYFNINNICTNAIESNIKQSDTDFEVVQKTNILEGQKVKDGDEVIITTEITNIGCIDTGVYVQDNLPSGLEVENVKLITDTATTDASMEVINNILFVYDISIKAQEKVTLEIKAKINTIKIVEKEITNQVIVASITGNTKASNIITIQVESNVWNTWDEENENPTNPEDPTDPENPDDPSEPENPGDETETTYIIDGYAWVDKNKNNNQDSDEAIKDVTVKIIDLNNKNTFLKNADGKVIEAKTDADGYYKLEGLPKGNYNIIFKYDTSLYELEETSEIKNYIIETTAEKVAITENINLNENKTVDFRLIELTEFDLKVDKYISKVIVQTANGTKTVDYKDKQLVREEIQSKYLSGATVLVEYTIKISNIGELAGYATEIIDYLPEDMKFHSELNTQWYMGEDGNLYNTSLSNDKIDLEEQKEVKLVLLKTMTKENTGITSNIAEISQIMNSKDYTDIDVSNNQSKAEIMINPITGTVITYLVAISNAIIIVAIGMYFIKKKVVGKEWKI